MSDILFTVPFSDVTAIRITCQRKIEGKECGGTTEVPIERLHVAKFCPLCQLPFDKLAVPFGGLQGVFKQMMAMGNDGIHMAIVAASSKTV